jgi:outer membrane protein assembly factor BamB
VTAVRVASLLAILTFVAATKPATTAPARAPEQCYGGVLVYDRGDCYRAVVLDSSTGRVLATVELDGPILSASPDGHGGWYVGGSFKHVDGAVRKRLAHLDGEGRLDANWRPEANGNAVSVRSLVVGHGRVFVAGDFAFVNRRSRRGLAAFDLRTGRLDSRWRPSGPAAATSLVFAAGHVVADGTVALDPTSGKTAWSIPLAASFEGGGVATATASGDRIYLAGIFSRVGGVARHGLAAVNARTGRVDRAWRPRAWRVPFCPPCNGVTAVAASPTRIYVARSAGRSGSLVALDPTTGAPRTGWRASFGGTTSEPVTLNAVAVTGGRVFAGGVFRRAVGVRRRGLAAFDARSARPRPTVTFDENSVNVTAVAASGSRVLVAGLVTNAVTFTFTRFRAYKPFSRSRARLRIGVSLSGPGTLRVELGRRDRRRCLPVPGGDCPGRIVAARTATFASPGIDRLVTFGVGKLRPGRYFVRFTPHGRGGPGQPATAYSFTLRP